MNDHLPQAIREALAPFAPFAPYAPPVESLNDDDAYVVDMGRNCIVRQCSAALLRSGGSIPVGLNQAVMTGMHARHHIAYEQERRSKLGKPAGGEISPENRTAEVVSNLPRITERRGDLLAALIDVTASLAWHAHGECRAVHDGPILPSGEAVKVGRAAIANELKGGAA